MGTGGRSLGGQVLPYPIVKILRDYTGNGYWLIASNGEVYPFGDAPNCGSLPDRAKVDDIVSAAMGQNGRGYWLAQRNGDVWTFNSCPNSTITNQGNAKGRTTSPIVAMVGSAAGTGYSIIEQSGLVYYFNMSIPGPTTSTNGYTPYAITSADSAASGTGMWLLACDGGLASLGNAAEMGHPYGVSGQYSC